VVIWYNLYLARTDFNKLLNCAHETQRYLYAKDTSKNIKSHIRTYLIYCTYFNRIAIPADANTLVGFAEFMSFTVGYQHIKHLFSSIRLLHSIFNLDCLQNDFRVDAALQSLKRKLAKTPLQVLPIEPEILTAMALFLDLNKPADQAFWASLLVAFFCLFRKKSLVPKSRRDFNSQTELSRRKIAVYPDENLAFVYANFSKTNQFCERETVLPLVGNPNSILNPVAALDKLFKQNPANPDDPAFTYFENGRKFCITYDMFTVRLKKILFLAGYNPKLYSGHSLRRGGACWLYKQGGDHLMIRYAGDWASDIFVRYVWIDINQRLKAQKLMSTNC
jgi:hypothetical protein